VRLVTHKLREFCTSVERLAVGEGERVPLGRADVCDCPCARRSGQAPGGAEVGARARRWAREHCRWDMETVHRAAWEGHLGVMRRALKHGCPWGKLDV